MLEKIPFIVLITLIPYQAWRIFKAKDYKRRVLDILIGGVIGFICATSWPIYLSTWLSFSGISLLFSGVLAFDAHKNKNSIYYFTSIILFIISIIFFLLYFFDITFGK
ncbi:hypothetical protein [Candidatus Neptunochlamydia vexilliferae]|uniref:Uncharacterized protein n=1 Tax=Candidatus Neptunichlamydia vexilliferae TaxID=1651774 RepID=A0ABS0AYM6_9BACT|nr:hypothetical protein [Candidatus Neptunochlamydia vexilliferae]MBF5059238.1 hypothetical protein [Candidatus Neptunochlamydia vexilliferae]